MPLSDATRIDPYELEYFDKSHNAIRALEHMLDKAKYKLAVFVEFLDGKYGLGDEDGISVETGMIVRKASAIAEDGTITEKEIVHG